MALETTPALESGLVLMLAAAVALKEALAVDVGLAQAAASP